MFSSQVWQHFHFLRPEWGLLLILPLITLLLQWRQADETHSWSNIIAPHLLKALRLRQFRSRLLSPVTGAALLMLLLTLIVMGPSWRQQPSPLARDEAALVILLDVSRSMTQQDIQPSRLQRAKQKISDLLALRGGARSALVVYAGSAHTVLSLTDDNDILNQYLVGIDPAIMPRSGKFAEYSLPLVERIVAGSQVPTTLLLVTDGVSSVTESVFESWFAQRQHQLLVWGVGLAAGQADASGAPLELDALRALADASNGHYVALSIDKTDVNSIHRRINSHYVVTDDNNVPWLDSGYWLVFPALAVFALWFRRGWTLQWMLAGVLVVGSLQPQQAHADNDWFTSLWLTPDQAGRLLLERGDYLAAAQRFASPMWKGVAYYYAEEFKLSAEYFSRVDSPAARFNRANALTQGQNYALAVRIYEELLRVDPDNQPAAHNRRIVQDIIDAINLMSESQKDNGENSGSKELGDDDPQRADGADEKSSVAKIEQLSAEEILRDAKINEMWMRSVQRDPSHFLAVKFSMQLEAREQ